MGNVFGRRPKSPAPVRSDPTPTDVPAAAVRKDVFSQLAKRRKATVSNQVTGEPSVLRRTLGGA